MIYDRTLTVYSLQVGASPLVRKLHKPVKHYYCEREVYASRFAQARQVGDTITMLVSIPRMPYDERVTADQYCVPDDGRVYRITQAQHGYDSDGRPITTLSLAEPEGKYELLQT